MNDVIREMAAIGARLRLGEIADEIARLEVIAADPGPVIVPKSAGKSIHVARKRKRKHWTQTPEGRARMARIARKWHRTQKGV